MNVILRRERVGRLVLGVALILMVPDPLAAPDGGGSSWVALEPGLELGLFPARIRDDREDAAIRVLRIDPGRFAVRLFNASAPGQGSARSAREWSDREGLLAAVNASMYAENLVTSVSLMRTRTHTNHARLSKDMAVLAFDRLDSGVPDVQIIDRECQDLEALGPHYGTLVQSIRMVSCTGANVWTPQPRQSSLAAIGIDAQGRVLFIHSSALLSTHDQIERLLRLPIDLKRCMYTEGGSEAQMFIRAGGREYSYGAELYAALAFDGGPPRTPRVPNVIGIVRKTSRALTR